MLEQKEIDDKGGEHDEEHPRERKAAAWQLIQCLRLRGSILSACDFVAA